jgi:hypothetical protein
MNFLPQAALRNGLDEMRAQAARGLPAAVAAHRAAIAAMTPEEIERQAAPALAAAHRAAKERPSMPARRYTPSFALYCAARHGLLRECLALRREMRTARLSALHRRGLQEAQRRLVRLREYLAQADARDVELIRQRAA